MANDAYGNVILAPGSTSKSRVNDDELLYSYSPPPFIKGGTLAMGQGVLALGTPLERDRVSGLYVKAGTDSRTIAGPATIVASTGVFTTPAAHGLSVGDQVQVGAVTTTTGITAATTYYVITVPSPTTFTLSATSGGSALALTGNGSVANVTLLEASEAPTGIKGFLRTGTYTGVQGVDLPRLCDIVMGGQLKYDKIKAANGGTDLTNTQVTALNGRIDTDLLVFIF